MSQAAYLDSSAIVKTVVEDPESTALRRFLRDFEIHASAELARAEVVRAIRRAQPSALPRTFQALERLVLITLSETLLDSAGMLDPPQLRTLDAIHLAAARTVAAQLGALVTYDERMAAAGAALGLPIESPS
jgi:predicted nucleic acid-binding protein